jgi:hypothetical protein
MTDRLGAVTLQLSGKSQLRYSLMHATRDNSF